MIEGKVVAKQDEPVIRVLDGRHQGRKAVDIFAMDFHQFQRVAAGRCSSVDRGMHRLDQR